MQVFLDHHSTRQYGKQAENSVGQSIDRCAVKFKSRKEMHGKCNSCIGLPGGNEAARQQRNLIYIITQLSNDKAHRREEHEWIYAVCAAGKNKH